MFCAYISLSIISDVSEMLFVHYGNASNYTRLWHVTSEVDGIAAVLLLLEIILVVWRRHHSPRNLRDEILLAVLLAAAALTLWPIAEGLTPRSFSYDTAFIFGFQEVLCLMFIACGGVLVILRRRLSLNWTDPEFQVAVGIGFFSGFSLLAAMLRLTSHEHVFLRLIDQVSEVSYLVTLVYWICCFFRPRRPAGASAHKG
jgi:hypothetical protein